MTLKSAISVAIFNSPPFLWVCMIVSNYNFNDGDWCFNFRGNLKISWNRLLLSCNLWMKVGSK